MTFTRDLVRHTIVRGLWLAAGRRNLVRFSRLLTMESRLDVANDMARNGEIMVQQKVLAAVREGANTVVFDVGANIGLWTKSLLDEARREQVDGVRAYCFEPASSTYQKLCEQLGPYDSATPVRVALSNKSGEADFNIFGEGFGINSLHEAGTGRTRVEARQEKVEIITADSFCDRERISEIALLKIDAEGHDFAVMQGATRMLSTQRIQVIQFEYNHRWIYSRHYLKDVFDLLLPLGYRVGKITPQGIEFYPNWHFELESFREGNYLACLPTAVSLFPQVPWWNLDGP